MSQVEINFAPRLEEWKSNLWNVYGFEIISNMSVKELLTYFEIFKPGI